MIAFWWREIDEASAFWFGDSMGGKGNKCDGNSIINAVRDEVMGVKILRCPS